MDLVLVSELLQSLLLDLPEAELARKLHLGSTCWVCRKSRTDLSPSVRLSEPFAQNLPASRPQARSSAPCPCRSSAPRRAGAGSPWPKKSYRESSLGYSGAGLYGVMALGCMWLTVNIHPDTCRLQGLQLVPVLLNIPCQDSLAG